MKRLFRLRRTDVAQLLELAGFAAVTAGVYLLLNAGYAAVVGGVLLALKAFEVDR